MTDKPTRVLIVDDHVLFAEALASVLVQEGLDVVGTAASLSAGIEIVDREHIDVVLLDYRLPDSTGIDGAKAIRELAPHVAVVIVTATEDERVLLAAVEAGCAGFVTKTSGIHDVHDAVKRAAAGEASISPVLLSRLLRRLSRQQSGLGQDLTKRERDVLQAITEGLNNNDIAQRLVVSVNTVRNHVQAVLTKLGAHSKLEAAAIAVREGIIEPAGHGHA